MKCDGLRTFLVMLGIFIFSNAYAFAGNIYVYSHVSNKEDVDLAKAIKIFQGGKLTWGNGVNILVLLDQLDVISDEDFKKFSQMNKSEFLDVWRVKFFSGRALVPIQIKNSSKALETLLENPTSLYFSFKKIPLEDQIAEKVLVY